MKSNYVCGNCGNDKQNKFRKELRELGVTLPIGIHESLVVCNVCENIVEKYLGDSEI